MLFFTLAVIMFDVSTTSLVQDMDNIHFKQEMMQNGANLIDSMKNMQRYLKHMKRSQRAIKSKLSCCIVFVYQARI